MFYYPSALVGEYSLCAILWITVASRYHWDKTQSITEASKRNITWGREWNYNNKTAGNLIYGAVLKSSYIRLTRETLINIATPLVLHSPAQTALPSLWIGLDSDPAGYRISILYLLQGKNIFVYLWAILGEYRLIKNAQFLPTFLFEGLIAFVEFVRLIVDGNGEDIPHNNRNGEVMCCYYLLQYKMFALIGGRASYEPTETNETL